MATYKIYTLGCKVNQYDSGKLASELERAGLVMADGNADVVIINSCAVTKTAMIKSGRMIKLARKENPQAKIALAGCWPRAEGMKDNMAGADLVARERDLIKIIPKFKIKDNKKKKEKNIKLANQAERSRYFIKIQDGCEQFCSYCIIPYTRGKLKSRAVSEVIAEIKQAVKAGYMEIVLSGIHLGLYLTTPPPLSDRRGGVAGGQVDLASLLNKIIKINGLGRVRLSSIEITEVTAELVELMAESNKICKHLHIPLQSGSDKILKLMNRPYNLKYYKQKIKNIRQLIPDIAISADVIVGFPGETGKDFMQTEKFIKQIKFSRLQVFPFSAHEKLPAAKMTGQIPEKIKARRAGELRKLNLKLMADYKNKFKGRELAVAVERVSGTKLAGKTEFYFEVEIARKDLKNKNIRVGEIVKVIY